MSPACDETSRAASDYAKQMVRWVYSASSEEKRCHSAHVLEQHRVHTGGQQRSMALDAEGLQRFAARRPPDSRQSGRPTSSLHGSRTVKGPAGPTGLWGTRQAERAGRALLPISPPQHPSSIAPDPLSRNRLSSNATGPAHTPCSN